MYQCLEEVMITYLEDANSKDQMRFLKEHENSLNILNIAFGVERLIFQLSQ